MIEREVDLFLDYLSTGQEVALERGVDAVEYELRVWDRLARDVHWWAAEIEAMSA